MIPPHSKLHRIRLRHLTCFLEIERAGSARVAAQALFVTESAVSKTLAELEAELDARLFERARSGMQLTEAGRRFARYARSAVDALSVGIEAARSRSEDAPRLSIGAMPAASAALLPGVFAQLLVDMPSLVLEVISGSKGALLDRLRKGQLAFVLGRMPPTEDLNGLSFEQLFIDRYIFAVRPAHPLARAPALHLQQLAGYPLLMPSSDTVTWGEIERAFTAADAQMSRVRLETIDLRLSRDLVATSDAVWACSEMSVKADLAAGSLMRLPVVTPLLDAPIGLMRQANVAGDYLGDTVAAAVRSVVADFSSGAPSDVA